MKILSLQLSTIRPKRFVGHLTWFCLLWLVPGLVLAQNESNKPKSFEAQKTQPSIKVNGQDVPISGHNNINKLIRMAEKNNGSKRPFPGLEDLQSRETYEWMMLRDPKTNEIPANIHEMEMEFAEKLLLEQGSGRPDFGIGDNSTWKRRGPYNVGGRTRALAIDKMDTSRILAGGVSGGMWLSIDGGDSWTKTTNTLDLQSVTCIVQDTTDGTGLTWYYGTGEIRGNSAAGNGAPFRGNGIFKSTDGGLTWAPLESTQTNTPHIFDPDFDYIHNLAIDPTNGDVWVAAFGNIFTSQDGGTSWDTVLVSEGTWTDVAITPTGDIYATLGEGGGGDKGVFYKKAGDVDFSGITPPEFQAGNLSRTVLSISPTNEEIVYFLADTPGSGTLGHVLMKYVHDESDDTSGFMGTWEDRSASIPAFGGSVGNFNSQGAYNLLIQVHPLDTNVVFVGGTNIYRSTNGFASSDSTTWIGGYATVNNVSIYPNQHPDQHVLTFYPNDPTIALSGNDGGVHKTLNILENEDDETPVNWISLNNGYYTTQPYAISIDPTAENPDLLMAGFQDNGTWLSTNEAAETVWTEEFGGDGSFNAMADGGRTRLVSSQNGNLYAFYYADANDPNSFTGFARIVPAGAAGFSFVNPFILDPNNDKVIYLATSSGIWRNSNYTEIPLFTNGTTSVNWSQVPGTTAANGSVTTLEASTLAPNVVYFGTSSGEVWRVENAHTGAPIVENVSEGDAFLGSVSSIAIDPKDADRVIITLSNYNVRSIFYTEDGGENWTDISGNLEEEEDGVGAGPSVRWVEMLDSDNGIYYLAGTSTGLYSTQLLETDTLSPEETVWELESEDLIGNVVIRHMAVRQYDGTISIATHANGMYETQLQVTPEDRIFAGDLDDIEVLFGTDSLTIDIEGLFVDEGDDNSPLEISVYENTNDSLVSVILDPDNELMTLVFSDTLIGIAGITISAQSDDRIAFSSFSVSVEELVFGKKPVFNQVTNPGGAGITSQIFTDLGGPVWSADDFEVPEGATWDISQVFAPGSKNSLPIDSIVVQFWLPSDDTLALPAIIFYSDTVVNQNGPDDGNMLLNLRETLQLSEGYYWVSITPILPFAGNAGRWFWNRTAEGFGNQYHLIDPANLFGAGFTDWVPGSNFNATLTQLNFSLNGVSSDQAPTPPVSAPFAFPASPNDIELSWNAGEFDLAYILYTSEDGENFDPFFTIRAEEVNTYEFSGLDPNEKYYFGIKTIDVVGDTTEIAIDSALTFPEVPQISEASDVTSTSFTFDWDAVSADSIIIQLADDELLVVEDTIFADVETYTFSDLDPITFYEYRIAAANASGFFDFSEPMEVTTLPSTPDSLSITSVSNNAISLKWNVNSDTEEIEGYQVLRGLDMTDMAIIDTLVAEDEMYLTYEDSLLEGNTQYYYGVEAYVGEITSEPAKVDTLTFPNVPVAIAASDTANTSFKANWEAVSADGYYFDFAMDSLFTNSIIDDSVLTDVSLMLSGLSPSKTYYYRVSAFNSTGKTGYSNVVATTTTVTTPENLMISEIVQTSALVSWDSVEGVSEYRMDLATTEDFTSAVFSDSLVSGLSLSLTGLDIYTDYFVRVLAVGTESNSDYTEVMGFKTLPELPNTPTNVVVVQDDQDIVQVTWDLTSGDIIDYVLIERSSVDNQSFAPLDSLVGEVTSYTDNTLPDPSIYYYYRVKAGNLGGTSAFSEEVITGINEELNAGISIWPNPTGDNAILSLNDLFSGRLDVDIINASGQVVKTMKVNKTTLSVNLELDLQGLSKGLYLIQISTEKGLGVKRILKQ